MTKVTRYSKPFPPMTEHAHGGAICPVTSGGRLDWCCTRPTGHDGDHEAGNSAGEKLASWPRRATS